MNWHAKSPEVVGTPDQIQKILANDKSIPDSVKSFIADQVKDIDKGRGKPLSVTGFSHDYKKTVGSVRNIQITIVSLA